MRKTYRMVVQNKPGCLDRIAGMTRRYGWNIEGMVAAETPDVTKTRITISLSCDKFCEMPDEAIRALSFVLSMEVCDDEHYSFHMILVARGPEDVLQPYLDRASRIEHEGENIVAWWLSNSDDEIAELQAELNQLEGVNTVRSGPMALIR